MSNTITKIRRASHAGTWYYCEPDKLGKQLDQWLQKATVNGPNPISMVPARAVIAPHAGYLYCGACEAYGYLQVDPTHIRRVFILGPSHHVKLFGCSLSSAEYYQTPFYNLEVDTGIYNELYNVGDFKELSMAEDEDEHSIEMQLPYIARVMNSRRGEFTIVPVLVGALSPEKEHYYGRIFSKYLADPTNLFVISSDFCHWGKRFHYTFHNKGWGPIWQSIEHLDRKGMEIIETMDPEAFSNYLKEYGNTICGRHPIGVLLNAIQCMKASFRNGHRLCLKFLKYDQSNRCVDTSDSSVSYATAALTIQS